MLYVYENIENIEGMHDCSGTYFGEKRGEKHNVILLRPPMTRDNGRYKKVMIFGTAQHKSK